MLCIADYERLTDIDEPTELVRGVLVRRKFSSFLHGIVCVNIGYLLHNAIDAHGSGHGMLTHGIITHEKPDSVRSVDAAYYSEQRLPSDSIRDEYLRIVPEIGFEVRSQEDDWFYLARKAGDFIDAGADVFCVVDPYAETVHVFRPDASVRILKDDDHLSFPEILPEFSHSVREILE